MPQTFDDTREQRAMLGETLELAGDLVSLLETKYSDLLATKIAELFMMAERQIRYSGASRDQLDQLFQRVHAARESHEASQIKWPLVREIDLGTSKSANDAVAEDLNLPNEAANLFRYMATSLPVRIRIEESGRTSLLAIKESQGEWFEFPRALNLTCA
jgi:hypothetical protein